jgi:hypothetical protein
VQLEAGVTTEYITVEASIPIPADESVTLQLICSASFQPSMTVTFTPATTGKIALAYRAPLQCGWTDSCEWQLSGSAADLFVPPHWDNSVFGATIIPAWSNARQHNLAIESELRIAGL